MRSAGVLALVLALLVLAASPAEADVTTPTPGFVYGLNLFNGVDYSSGFAPAAVDTIYILADADSVVDPKITNVYFWPTTNEWKADFTTLDRLVPGTLEVSRGGQLVVSIALDDYVVQFDRLQPYGGAHLYLGADAAAHYRAFEQARADYVKRVDAYSAAMEQYQAKLDAAVQAESSTKQPTAAIPSPPAAPPEFTLYSTDPARGFPLRLPTGEYAIRVRDATGKIVPASEKRLVAIAPRRESIGYQVVPRQKWTYPSAADDPSDVIYGEPNGVVYLQPFRELEFNELAYARLKNPQDRQGTSNHWTWVHVAPVTGATLAVADGAGEKTVRETGYKVDQIPGAALGYVVRPVQAPVAGSAAPPEIPDFEGFPVGPLAGRTALTISLRDASGREIPGSRRQVVGIADVSNWRLGVSVALPLLIGLTAVLRRREQVLSARRLPAEQRNLLA